MDYKYHKQRKEKKPQERYIAFGEILSVVSCTKTSAYAVGLIIMKRTKRAAHETSSVVADFYIYTRVHLCVCVYELS